MKPDFLLVFICFGLFGSFFYRFLEIIYPYYNGRLANIIDLLFIPKTVLILGFTIMKHGQGKFMLP